MSNYTPKYIDRDAWQCITATIRRYPKLIVELYDGEQDIIYGGSAKENTGGHGGYISDPTASKGIRLASTTRNEFERKVKAVAACRMKLSDEHSRVICLRFWGTEEIKTAVESARQGIEPMGMRYESIKSPSTMDNKSGYCSRQAKRIVQRFIYAVGKELGEI